MNRFFIYLILLVFSSIQAIAKENNINNKKPKLTLEQKIVETANSYLDNHKMHVSYAFSKGGEVFHKDSVGYFNYENKKKLELSHSLPLISLTKTYTATAILLLQDRGLLNVNDKLSKFLPNGSDIWPNGKMPSWADKITLHNLLTHSDGITDYFSIVQTTREMKPAEFFKNVVAYQVSKPLNFEPGTDTKYGNSGFWLLGIVIEKVSGKSYRQFIGEEIIDKFGLTNTYLFPDDEAYSYLGGELAEKYPSMYIAMTSQDDEQNYNTTLQDTHAFVRISGVPFSDFGIFGNVEDMLKFQNALHGGKILSEESYNQMITPHYKADKDTGDARSYYGYGMYVSIMPGKLKYLHHEGTAPGMRADAGYIPSLDIFMSFLSNVSLYTNPERVDRAKENFHPESYRDIIDLRDDIFKSIVAYRIAKEVELHKGAQN